MDNSIIEYVTAHEVDYNTFKEYNSFLRNISDIQNGLITYYIKASKCKNTSEYFTALSSRYNKLDGQAIEYFSKYYHSTMQSNWRVKKRIDKMLYYADLYNYSLRFLTFTFDDDSLDSLSAKTKRVYITRFLNNENVVDYIGNIDYGKKNGRIHFHVMVCLKDNLDLKKWHYGTINVRKFNRNSKSISKYIVKLGNHAVKEQTNGQNKLSCRSTRYDDFLKQEVIEQPKYMIYYNTSRNGVKMRVPSGVMTSDITKTFESVDDEELPF